MDRTMWIGKDEHQGVRALPRPDVKPPPHWRLEAIAATPRPHALTLSADRRRALFVQDADFSDLWLLELDGSAPERLTAGRALANWWEAAAPRLAPDGTRVAYVDGGDVHLAPVAGGPPRRLLTGDEPVWIDDARLVVAVERDDETRLAVVGAVDPWPRRLAPHDGSKGDELQPAVSPDRTSVAYAFVPRADLGRSEIRVATLGEPGFRALTGTPGMRDREPAWSPDGRTLAFASERSGFYELHLIEADGTGERQLTHAGADHGGPEWHPDGTSILATRTARGRTALVAVDARTGEAATLAEGGSWSVPHWTAAGAVVAAYEDWRTPPELRRVADGATRTLHAPAPRPVRRAPHAELEDVTFPSFDGLEIHAFLLRPRGASADTPVPAVVYPHGGPIDFSGDLWDGEAQFFVDKGYAWLAPNFRGSASYGRAFEHGNHGFWGVGDTQDCLAAAGFLRTLDFVRGDRLAIFGASYGSYMALSAVTDDPEHRFRCAVCKYGDTDIVTSWAQGDRSGVQELEMIMGTPASAPDAYRAGSPFHRLENVEVPILVATGELDRRVSPRQSEQLVGELRRLGKTFEYVTYPTEAHGLLRPEPFVDFYERLARFLDWHLM